MIGMRGNVRLMKNIGGSVYENITYAIQAD